MRIQLFAAGIIALVVACGKAEPEVLVVTATPLPATLEPTAAPTRTPLPPSPTFQPTSTPQPRFDSVPIGEVEDALHEAGYRRFPFTNEDLVSGYYWIKESAYEQATTWENGAFELQVLHDKSPNVRSDHMQSKFDAISAAFPPEFMAELRMKFDEYNRGVRADVSGEPDQVISYGGDWKDVWAEYYASESTTEGYNVRLSVWWWQTTCPPKYLYCYFNQFPGLEFTGDSSFKFLTVHLEPLSETVPTNGT